MEEQNSTHSPVSYDEDADRLTADQMDIKRHEQMAYEYLSRLNELASWLSECLGEDLPSGIDLEAIFPNGVFLAKLAHFFSPETVSLSKIFDIDQQKFMESGLHFRHTDNIMQWIRAMRYLSFPEVFIPDTTDIYDSKNLPKAVFCLIALSLFLYRKGLAPPIRDAQKEIQADEVSRMAEILRERGVRLPPFSKIEGMLADQLSPDQAELHAAVVLINEAIDSGDEDKVLEALQQPAAHIHLVRPIHKAEYMNSLVQVKTDKCSHSFENGQAEGELYDRLLTRDELQYSVDDVNTSEAHHQIVRALLKGTPEDTVKSLQDPVLKLPRVWLSAAPLYHCELKRLQKESKGQLSLETMNVEIKGLNAVVEVNERVANEQADELLAVLRSDRINLEGVKEDDEEHTVGHRYLTKFKHDKEHKIDSPCPMLTKADIQSVINSDHNQEQDMKMKILHDDAAAKIQSKYKGWKEQQRYKRKLQHYHSTDTQDQIIKAQSHIRRFLQQKEYQKRLQFLQEQDDSVQKIQRFFRKNQNQKDFQILTQSENPSLPVVRKYASLLVETELDYDEDLESHTLKKSMTQIIQSNRKLEEELSVMDVKIGLLVKNRLGIEEVLKHGQRVSSQHDRRLSTAIDDDLSPVDESPKKAAFKAALRSGSIMDKTNRTKINTYEHMLYVLQVQPKYMAKLILTISSGKLTRLIELVCLPLFNYAAQAREEYLFLQLFKHALLVEIDTKVKTLDHFSTTNLVIPKLAADLSKQVYGEVNLHKTLAPVIEQVLKDPNDHINLNPIEIYKFLVDEPKEGMTDEEAADNEDVAEVLQNSIAYLVKWADVFLMALIESKHSIPYLICYLGKVVRAELKAKLMISSKDACKAVGFLIFSMYINPAIASPDPNQAKLTSDDKKKLANIAKLLTYSALNQGYGDDYSYLAPINQFIKTFHEKLRCYIETLIDVVEPEDKLGVDNYIDYTSNKKPTVVIPASELIFVHELLESNRKELTNVDPADDLEDILIDASPVPKLKELIGNCDNEDENNKGLTLTLSPKRSETKVDDHQNTLFLQTKKMVLDIILCQQGANLSFILNTLCNDQQEALHKELQLNNDELRKDRKSVLMSDALFSLEDKKEKVQENLDALENMKLVSSEDNYQAVITAIAKDIRRENYYRKSRRAELERLKDTLHRLQDSRNYKIEQLRTWNEYIKGCLENLAPKSNKRKSLIGNGDTASKSRSAIKATAEKLAKKKILKDMENATEKEFKNTTIEILSSDTAGLFEITVTRPKGAGTTKSDIQFQELLKMQYEEKEDVVLGECTYIVDELIFYLNKKFYF